MYFQGVFLAVLAVTLDTNTPFFQNGLKTVSQRLQRHLETCWNSTNIPKIENHCKLLQWVHAGGVISGIEQDENLWKTFLTGLFTALVEFASSSSSFFYIIKYHVFDARRAHRERERARESEREKASTAAPLMACVACLGQVRETLSRLRSDL